MPEKKYKLCYPQLGNYDIPIQYFVNNGLHLEYLAPPAMTKRTIELGAKYSPDFVCAPFKCMMGCYIEALEQGANVLIQTGGTCRLGYYGELHEHQCASGSLRRGHYLWRDLLNHRDQF